MKSLVCLGFMALSLQSAAFASNVGQVSLSAQNPVQLLQLVDQRFEPIYGQEAYESTCDRQVVDHTETRCETVTDSVCHGGGEVCETTSDSVCNSSGCVSVPRRVCHTEPQTCENVPRRSCSDYSVYRTEYYSCTKYRQVVVGQRLVKTFNHQIEVVVANPILLSNSSLAIGVRVSENSVSAEALSAFPRKI